MATYNPLRIFAAAALLSGIFAAPAFADIASWQKGAAITPTNPTELGTSASDQALANLKAVNANAVSFVIPIYQANLQSSEIQAGSNTPTDTSLIHAIQTAHALGLSVTLKPHLDPQTWQWRAFIDPTDRALWFKNYGAILTRYAALAQTQGVEQIVVGTELVYLTSDSHNPTNTANWKKLIADVRAVYSGTLTYAANWGPSGELDEKNNIGFWSDLDYVGIDAYYKLGTDFSEISPATYLTYWDQWNINDFSAFEKKVKKPIIFTEIGYKSTSGAHLDPGDYNVNNGYNAQEQANAYQAFFSYWANVDFIKGMYIWEWKPQPNAGGEGNVDYTPQNKLAQTTISNWYGGSGVATILQAPPKLSATAKVALATVAPNQNQTITAAVANAGGEFLNGILDIEVYDANGSKVFQKFFENQTVAGASTSTKEVSFQTGQKGLYTVKIGVFKAGWSVNHVWNGTAASFTVGDVPTAVPAFSASGTAALATLAPGSNEQVNLSVVNSGGSAANALVDIEIYNAANQQVFQRFFEGQSFAGAETKQYQINWTPTLTDTYRVALGVFSAGWSQNYLWNGSVTSFVAQNPVVVVVPTQPTSTSTPVVIVAATSTIATSSPATTGGAATTTVVTITPATSTAPVATSTPTTPATTTPPVATSTPVVELPLPQIPTASTTPTANGVIQVWWPTTDSWIGGTQPFKAMVENTSVDEYEMYWQVEGGALNWMYSTPQDYPHKEQWVDVSGWNWKGTGPYTLTFTAKSKASGAVIATKTIKVNVWH